MHHAFVLGDGKRVAQRRPEGWGLDLEHVTWRRLDTGTVVINVRETETSCATTCFETLMDWAG